MRLLTVFLDTSVILSGLASPSGGSRKLFEAAAKRKLKLLASPYILEETIKHLEKLAIERVSLEELFSEKIVNLIANPPDDLIKKFHSVSLDPDDAHVIAAAALSGADILLSLDKKHILIPIVRRVLKPIMVKSPKEFWHWLQKSQK